MSVDYIKVKVADHRADLMDQLEHGRAATTERYNYMMGQLATLRLVIEFIKEAERIEEGIDVEDESYSNLV